MRLLDAAMMVHAHLLRAMVEDYSWCVENGIFEDDPVGRQSFVLGYADMEERIRGRTWRSARARHEGSVRRAV